MKKINKSKLIVIKIGSSLTTLKSGLPNLKFIKLVCEQIHKLKSRSKPVENKAHNTDRSHFSYLTGSKSS